ncbi:MAG: hypothetical protein ACKOPM_06225 [Novosphingobium sp.]
MTDPLADAGCPRQCGYVRAARMTVVQPSTSEVFCHGRLCANPSVP